MDTQLLHAFAAVAEGGSFSMAAEQLNLTQPAVSKRIAQLEAQLDSRLFDRFGRQVTLTEAGRALLPHAQTILQEIRSARRHIQDLRGGVTGVLTMGISHHLGLHRLPPLLRQFTHAYPEVRLDIDFLDSEEAHERVLLGEVEMGVITLAPEAKPSLEHIPLWRDELVATAAPDHPLAAVGRLSLRDLSEHRAILPGLNTYTGRIIKGLFETRRLPLDIAMSTNYLETLKMMVSIGLGWSVLPRTLVDDSLRILSLPELSPKGRPLGRDLGVVIHRDRSLSNAANALLELLRQHGDAGDPTR